MAKAVAIAAASATAFAAASAGAHAAPAAAPCEQPVYLTFDTGHMGVAPLVADVLRRHHVPATFFLANERTREGGTSLDAQWAPWWKALAADGHRFGSHTWDHTVWLADRPQGFRVRATAGPGAPRVQTLSAAQYCEQIDRPAAWLRQATGVSMGSIYRAPGGKTSPALIAAARACGWTHVPWSPAGFLGDELPSDRWPNAALRDKALREIRPGDILLAHLGIWSRQDPWAPAVLEPLITGLTARGMCFATLDAHPVYGAAARTPHRAAGR